MESQRVWTSRASIIIGIITFAIVGGLLFARLGHYALWDDEANTALIGEGVWRTGDTSAVLGKNLVAFRNGGELENLKVRYLPPLQYYVAAPFVGPDGPSSFRARLPFAVIGLLAIGLLMWWLWKENATPLTMGVFAIAIVGNVSLMLYLRQCRYYALAVFLTVAIAYLYRFLDGKWMRIVLLVIASLALFASNYLNFLALYVCLGLDYLIWGRKRYWITWRQWLVLVVPQVVIGGLIAWTWNPLGKHVTQAAHPEGLAEKFKLLWWNLRDGTACEFWVAPLVVAAPIIAWLMPRWRPMWRLALAAVVYVLVITILSPQTISTTSNADVRYLAPMIPLCIALGALAVASFSFNRWWIALPIAVLAFGTNLLNGGRPGQLSGEGRQFGSTFCQYIGELWNPPDDPYTQTAQWINAHVAEGESIWVVIDYQTYPLMYHAPKAVYAWQLDPPPAGQFANLDPIQFKGRSLPDYIVAAGPSLQFVMTNVHFPPDVKYVQAAKIDCFWRDLFRPELIWRRFSAMPNFDHNADVIYIFKRTSATPWANELRL